MTFTPDMDLLSAAMDRAIPAAGDLPAAGAMGLAQEAVDRSEGDDRFWSALETVLSSLPSAREFGELHGDGQDAALSAVESGSPDAFGTWVDVVYTVYYMQPRVHQRIGWHGRTPQPEGNQMPPWDESVLANIRNREPFWRKV